MVGDYTKQRYLASMEGALFSGKLGAKAVVEVGLYSIALLCSHHSLQHVGTRFYACDRGMTKARAA